MITRGRLKDIFGREINTSGLAKPAQLKQETVEQSLDILMRLSMVTKLSAWMPEGRTRDIEQPKSPLVDTGIDAALRRPNEGLFDIGDSPKVLGEFCYRETAVTEREIGKRKFIAVEKNSAWSKSSGHGRETTSKTLLGKRDHGLRVRGS
ncbi:hypothetical protein [uncultured Roseobacter sp.]|uniref:DUF4143 domain-containing protein n=1 Tax=uncultured Roseobacter sp. TaxID=114847 RepID=UPI0026022B3A|nr:hypothetical protein [uncultured Roseobacter sp.]